MAQKKAKSEERSGGGSEKRPEKRKTATGKKTAKNGNPKHQEEEDEPVLSGRMVTALSLLLAMVIIPVSGLAKVLTKEAPKTAERATWNVGDTATIHLTVVTSDYNDLACADERSIDGMHCEFENDRERFPKEKGDEPVDDNKKTVLQPYRTTDGNLLLAAGLWAKPEVATRLHYEPPRGVSKDKLARFVVACDVEFLAEWEGAQVRWKTSAKWNDNGKAMVTKLLSCHILEEAKR